MRKWLYHATEEARIFEDEAIARAIEDGWHDSPDGAKEAPKTEVVDDVLSREELLSMAASLGVQVDKRWGVIRLREAIEEATKGGDSA